MGVSHGGGPNLSVNYSAKVSGPLFDGRLGGYVRRAIESLEDELGAEGVRTVRDIDDATFRNPTGHARSQVRSHRQAGVMTVDRSNLIYGPWLENGGSRSHLFSGYHAFERAAGDVQRRVPAVVARSIARYVLRD